jgi:hypothetical protein
VAQRRAELEDLRSRVESEVRNAFEAATEDWVDCVDGLTRLGCRETAGGVARMTIVFRKEAS